MIMFEAINEIPKNIKEKIVVVCTGKKEGFYYQLLIEKIDQYGLQEQFLFVGRGDPYEISVVSDFLFLPSYKEGFALNIAEAFFIKLPSARTATCGWADLKIGCLKIYADKTDEIKKIIVKLVTEGKETFSGQVDRAYKFACENLTVEIMIKNTVEVYNRAIEVCYGKRKYKRSTK